MEFYIPVVPERLLRVPRLLAFREGDFLQGFHHAGVGYGVETTGEDRGEEGEVKRPTSHITHS